MAEKMKQTMIGNTVVAVLPIALPEDEEQQAMIVMEVLLKVLVFFPRGIVLSKFNKMFATIFPTLALSDNGGWVPLLNNARDTMLEWDWLQKAEGKTKAGGTYNIISINPQHKNKICEVFTDADYDQWLEIAMNSVVADLPKGGTQSPTTLSGFNKFKNKVDGDVPF